MSLQFRIADQVLRVDDARDGTQALVHKYDAFLNLLCGDRYAFQRDAVREALRFLVSDQYPNLERLAREGQLAVYKHSGFWQCMDHLKDKIELEKLWNEGRAPWKVWE